MNNTLEIPIRDLTADTLVMLGGEGYRALAVVGDVVLFVPQIKPQKAPEPETEHG